MYCSFLNRATGVCVPLVLVLAKQSRRTTESSLTPVPTPSLPQHKNWCDVKSQRSEQTRAEKHCGEITDVQRWLGAQDIQDAPEKAKSYYGLEIVNGRGAVESEGDLGEWKGSHIEEKLKIADEHPMEKFDKEDSHEIASDRSIHHPTTEGADEIDLNVSPEHHAFGDEGNHEKKPTTVETPDKFEDQKVLNRVDQWPTLDSELKDQSSSSRSSSSSSSERLSIGSNTFHEIDQSKLEGVSNGSSTAHHVIEQTRNLDDSVDKGPDRLDAPGGPLKMTPEAENEKEESPKRVNSMMLNSQEEGDAFSTRQKYWAEGKRSPSSNKGADVGFPSFRIGEGRRSPSPLALSESEQDEARNSSSSPVSRSKSEQGEILSSSPVGLASYHSTVEDNNEGRGNPKMAVVQHEGSSSSSAHVKNDFEQAVHEQNTHDMICPVCGSDVTKRIILKKRKRTLVPEDDESLPEDDVRLPNAVMLQPEGLDQDQEVQPVESDDEAWGCLGCLSLFISSREGRVKKPVVPGAEGELIGTEQEEVRCLPLPIRWRPWTSEPELSEPLPSETARDDPRAPEDADEKRSWNCLPEVLPAFTSWGPIPVYDVEFSLDKEESPGALSSDQENVSAAEGQEEATSGSTEGEISEPIPVGAGHISDVPLDVPTVIREPQAHDAEEERNWNCLPELLPAFSWGPIPVYDVQYSVDTDKSPGVLLSDQENTTVVEGQQEATGGSPTTSLTKEPQSVEDAREKGSCNCLPELPPAFSWGKIPVVDNTYLPPSISGDDNSERPASLSGTAGHIPEVPLDDDKADLADSKRKRVVDEIGSNAGISVEKTEESLGPKRNSDHTHSHLESVSKEEATCSCLPVVLSTIHWRWTKTTTHDNERESQGNLGSCLAELQEPLLPQGSDQGIEPPAAEPVPLEDSTSTDLKETPETPAYPISRVPGHSTSSVVDFNEGTHTTESEDLHIQGTVTSHNTVTTTYPSEQPTEVNIVESDYHFDVGIQDGHFTSTVEKLPPKLPELEISNGEAGSSTVAESSVSSATSSDGPEQAHVPGDLEDTGAEISEEHLGQDLPKPITAQQNQEYVVTSAGIVPKPLKTFLSHIFPAVEIEDETEAKETGEQKSKLENDWCNCLPVSVKPIRWWRPSMDYKVEEGLEEHLLDKVEENEDGTSTDTSVAPQRDLPEDRTGERCNCLPALPKFSMYDVFRDHHSSPEKPLLGTEVDDIRAPLPGTTPPKRETVVNIDQTIDQTETNVTVTGPTTEGAAAEALAIAQGRSPSKTAGTSQEYLKSIVHGGLDVTLVSLGVVASGAGGDAKTITVIAIGLANLVFGLIKHLGTIISLYYNNRPKFVEDIGQGFVHGCLSFISFLFFGALAPITYGFSFRNATNRDYKFASTCVVALVCIVLLGAAQAHVKSKSAVRVISFLIGTGFVAAIAGYETGNYVGQLLKYFEFYSV